MLIRAGYSIGFQCNDYTPLLLMVHVRPELYPHMREPELLTLVPQVPYVTYADSFGNICTRLVAPPGPLSIWNRFLFVDSGLPEQLPVYARQHPIVELPNEVLIYLLGSRYCDTQKLTALAWSQFGGYPEGWPRVEAILNYTHNQIRFSYANARADRTAWEAHEEKTGVCRDFAHLALALCRCMNIPARYCTGYLGDIGVVRDPAPMDFSAWFEVYLGETWYPLDARHNHPRIGRILMARGRDAADVAISTAFGVANLTEFQVITEEAAG